MLPWRNVVSLALLAVLLGHTAFAQELPMSDWARVKAFEPGRPITVKLFDRDGKIRGTFQSADDTGFTLRVEDTQDMWIERARVRGILARRSPLRNLAPVYGGLFRIPCGCQHWSEW